MTKKWIIVGISGVTCGGKTSLAKELHELFPNNSIIMSQDDYFLDISNPRLERIPELNHYNYDSLSSLDMEKMLRDIEVIIQNRTKDYPPKGTGWCENKGKLLEVINTVQRKLEEEDINILIIEGFCIFNYKPIADLCDLKYYFTLSKTECTRRRKYRVYDPPDVPGYFEKYVWPQHLQQKEDVRKNVTGVKWFNGNSKDDVANVIHDILNIISCR